MTETRESTASFTAEERAAMQERAAEVRAARKRGKGADAEAEVLAKIAELPDDDRAMAERVHAIVREVAPGLAPRTWYGMPAYGAPKAVLFFQPGSKFGSRYASLGFNEDARLDDGAMWPTAYALTRVGAAEEAAIRELVRRAAGEG
ncbi:iron chaperone [Cellulomonas pakistanensis]|uniref:YdhG-like domain-containing protein n=1 Tax=Cellulomonas pakistanensis TaxID=992287 RepID=A0A919U3K6_9CELL|nr:DUF1801 domain-containing protein [Cellulomonas pakistanensis]GIG36416.1 hypothetical protein Cpa01nite_17970 [Cellulomonas pakistanensis]